MRIDLKIIMGTIFMLSISLHVNAQTQDSYEYNNEFIWGINKNSSGGLIGGIVFKKAKRLNQKMFQTYSLEMMNVKNAEETKVTAPTGNNYIYGKSNYLYALRFQYGRDIILFGKAPQYGVEIKVVFAGGPSIGILAPYYIERISNQGSRVISTIYEQYDPNNTNHTFDKIMGTGYLLQGLGNSKIKFGGNAKVGLNFEIGTIKSYVTGFEIGTLIDAYTEKILLMPNGNNKSVFTTVYFTLFYGWRK